MWKSYSSAYHGFDGFEDILTFPGREQPVGVRSARGPSNFYYVFIVYLISHIKISNRFTTRCGIFYLVDFYAPQRDSYTNRSPVDVAAITRVGAFGVPPWVGGIITMFRKVFAKINVAEKV